MSLNGSSTSEAAYLTAADLLVRRVSITWYEAVAIVRAVAEMAMDGGELHARVPEPDEIRLGEAGTIDAFNAAVTKEPVRRLGQLLQALIVQSDPPVQLRLAISQATASESPYSSVREYWDALAYFERPHRDAILRALYARASALPVMGSSTMAATLDDLAPLPQWSLGASAPVRARGRQTRWFATVAVILLGLAGLGAFVWLRRVGPQTQFKINIAAGRASDAVGNVVASGLSSITERLGLGRLASATADPPALVVPELAPTAKSAVRRASHPLEARATSFVAFDLQPSGLSAPAVHDDAQSPSNMDGESPSPSQEFDPNTYGPDSEGVLPPVGIRPRLPRELRDGVEPKRLGRIELVVRQDGTVESVKLIGQQRDIIDGLFLSVAKAWRFQPAMKNGSPVRYRKTIWIAAQ